jgi:WD40 repeat protein
MFSNGAPSRDPSSADLGPTFIKRTRTGDRGDDPRRTARGRGVCGQHAEGVGTGKWARAAHPSRPHEYCHGGRGDARRAVSASSDKTLKLWNLESGRELRSITSGHWQGWMSAAVTPDGLRLVSASLNGISVSVWDLASGCWLRGFSQHKNGVSRLTSINAIAVPRAGNDEREGCAYAECKRVAARSDGTG